MVDRMLAGEDNWRGKYRDRNNEGRAAYDPAQARLDSEQRNSQHDDVIRRNMVSQLRKWGVPEFTIDNLVSAAEWTPLVGDAMDVQDAGTMAARAWEDPTWGNIGGAGLMGAAALASIVPGGGDAAKKGLKGLAKDVAGEAVEKAGKRTIRAYHGSPHDFDRFDLSKIGTGEGAQAYGHGLYFAEREDTAKFYRDNYAKPPADEFKSPTARQLAQDQLQAWAGDIQGGIEDLRASLGNAKLGRLLGDADESRIADLEEAIAYMERGVPPGRMYEVNINADPEDFLDWNKPLSEQRAWEKQRQFWDEKLGDPDIITERLGIDPSQDTGEKLARAGMVGNVSDPGMAQRLKESGIPGIKYLDQGSRAAGEGSRNYVVFDDKLVEILRKYGLSGMLAGTGAASLIPILESGQSDGI